MASYSESEKGKKGTLKIRMGTGSTYSLKHEMRFTSWLTKLVKWVHETDPQTHHTLESDLYHYYLHWTQQDLST